MSTEARSDGAQMFANRLQKNRKQLKKWLQREGVSCYRLYDADIPEYAVAIDLYLSVDNVELFWVHVQEYEAPKNIDEAKASSRLEDVIQVLKQDLPVSDDRLFIKVRKQQKGKSQYEKLDEKKIFHTVLENGHKFEVNFTNYLDTGLFLDHRITRSMLQQEAQGRRFLNLFAYTGSGTVYAAAGGAVTTTTVDMSNTYLDWAQRNMVLNGLNGPAHEYIQANCLEWLASESGRRKYDLIFLDPPSFSSSKRMKGTFDVQRDQEDLLRKTLSLLAPGGILYFSNNFRRFKLDEEAFPAYEFVNISRKTLPKDFERNPKIHHCWRLVAPS